MPMMQANPIPREVQAPRRRRAPQRFSQHPSRGRGGVSAAGGFSLVEILLAIVIAGLALGAATKLFQRGFESQARAAEFTRAAHLAQGEIARLRALDYPQALAALRKATSAYRPPSVPTDGTVPFRWRGEILNVSDQRGVVDFAVHIVWPWPDQRYELTFRSALAQR